VLGFLLELARLVSSYLGGRVLVYLSGEEPSVELYATHTLLRFISSSYLPAKTPKVIYVLVASSSINHVCLLAVHI
jgi:hypothetical protein